MKENIKCHRCGHKFENEYNLHYPTGDCPITCSKCGEYGLCPKCGGELNKRSSSEEIRDYCGNGCGNCNWEHCGGCV